MRVCICSGVISCLFFFFQAEDGIRDIGVTGVQTCALPISPCTTRRTGWTASCAMCASRATRSRSEERRVGKECRSRGSEEAAKEIEAVVVFGKGALAVDGSPELAAPDHPRLVEQAATLQGP